MRKRHTWQALAGLCGAIVLGATAAAQNAPAKSNQNQPAKEPPQQVDPTRPTSNQNQPAKQPPQQVDPNRPKSSQNQPAKPRTTGATNDPAVKQQAENAAGEASKTVNQTVNKTGTDAGNAAGDAAKKAAGNAPNKAADAAATNAADVKSGDDRLLEMLAKEEGKYRRRLARIQRVETLAKEKGDEALLGRVAKVMAKLEAQHERKMAGLRQRFGERNVNMGVDRMQKARGKSMNTRGNRGRGGGKGNQAGADKVLVCHVSEEDGARRTIEISRSALQAHLDHGDTLGACPGDENRPNAGGTNDARGSNSGNGAGKSNDKNAPAKPQRGSTLR